MTSIQPINIGISKVIDEVHAAGTLVASKASSLLTKIEETYKADVAKYGEAFVKSHPSFAALRNVTAHLQQVAAAAVNRVGGGSR